MLDIKGIFLLTICIYYVTTEYKIHSNGWKPVSREQISNQLLRETQQNLVYPTPELGTKDPVTMNPNVHSNNEIIAEDNIKAFKIQKKKSHIQYNSKYEMDNDDDDDDNLNKTDTTGSRKPKKIDYSNSKNDPASVAKLNSKEKGVQDNAESASVVAEKKIGYAVTEDVEDIQDTNQYNFNPLYNYQMTPRDIAYSNSTLYNFLSKYNINTNNALKNYDMSRLNFNNAAAKFQQFWYPYRDRYNSLNHLPVDPMLAVFLSNYGHYMPNMYGIQSNYNNLYGYLASNNIHNNRPFGSYKVFSDTDSWN